MARIIRTTLEPYREIVVSEEEYAYLLRVGLVYDPSLPAVPLAPAFSDRQYAELLQRFPQYDQGRRVGVALTLAAGAAGNVDNVASGLQRNHVKLPATTRRWRLRGRNYNDRDDVPYSGVVNITGIWFGQAELGTTGDLTGNMTANPVQVAQPFSISGSTEFATPWVEGVDNQLQAYADHLISFGFTTSGQDVHRGVGTAWRSTNPGQAGDRTPAGGLTLSPIAGPADGAPILDLWLEVEVSASVPVVCYGPGDSLLVGTRSTYPIRDSWAMKHALANGVMPTFRAAHGSSLTHWTSPTGYRYTKYDGLTTPDAVIVEAGSNDIFVTTPPSLATMQSRLGSVLDAVRRTTGTNIYLATMFPRNGANTTAEREALRTAYNDYLHTLPYGTRQTFDLASAVESKTTPGLVDDRWMSVDLVHLNSAGYSRAANTIPAPLAVKHGLPALPRVIVPPVKALSVSDYKERWRADQIEQLLGSDVAAWKGLKGLTLTSAVDGFTSPVLQTGYEGRPVVRFDGVLNGLLALLDRTQPSAFFILGRMRKLPSGTNGIFLGANASTPTRGSSFVNSSGLLSVNAGATLTLTAQGVDTGLHVFGATFAGSASVASIDRVEATGTAGTESADRVMLGRWGSAGSSAAIDIEDVVFYGRALSAAERASVVTDLLAQ